MPWYFNKTSNDCQSNLKVGTILIFNLLSGYAEVKIIKFDGLKYICETLRHTWSTKLKPYFVVNKDLNLFGWQISKEYKDVYKFACKRVYEFPNS